MTDGQPQPSWFGRLWRRLTGAPSSLPTSASGVTPAATPARQIPIGEPWDPAVLARVRHLHLRARTITDALMQGSHRSRRLGQAVELAGYQEYQAGMDVRDIDWKVWGRSDRLVVKRYEAETELACTVVVDLSGDLGTGEAGVSGLPPLEGTKAGAAITLAATLAYWFYRQREPVGLHVIAGDGVVLADLPPRTGRAHLQLLFHTLAQARPGGRASLVDALTTVGGRVRRRSLVVVITDGMEEPARWIPALQAFARRKSDVRLLHVWDRGELTLRGETSALYFSPEGGEPLPIDPAAARPEFAHVVAEWLAEVRTGVIGQGAQYVAVPTDRPLDEAIRAVVRGVSRPVELP